MGNWKTARLRDVADINQDVIDGKWSHSHIRYIDISSVAEGHLLNPPIWMLLANAPSRAKRLLRNGDTVLSTVRPNRRSMFFASKPGLDWVVSTGFAVLRPKTNRIDPRFLYECVFDRFFTEYLISREKGAAYPAVSSQDIADAVIPFPPLDEQRAIARVLGTLDDKTELNRRTNETLEAIAQALFKSWFVDFDPVRVLSRKMPEKPPFLCAKALKKAGFPDRFQDSEVGPIPHGWTIGKIQDCCTQIQNGGTPRRDEPRYWEGGTVPWLTSGEVRKPIIIATESFITEDGLSESSAKWVPEYSTVIALYGATAGQVSFVSSPLTTNQAVCALIPKKSFAFFNYLNMRAATMELESKAVGSAQQNISKGIVEETQVIVASTAVIEQFDMWVAPIFDRWIANIHESRTLAALRDALLPKLLSGELRLKELEMSVGSVKSRRRMHATL